MARHFEQLALRQKVQRAQVRAEFMQLRADKLALIQNGDARVGLCGRARGREASRCVWMRRAMRRARGVGVAHARARRTSCLLASTISTMSSVTLKNGHWRYIVCSTGSLPAATASASAVPMPSHTGR